jgi:Domain of unknown function (DUF4331)
MSRGTAGPDARPGRAVTGAGANPRPRSAAVGRVSETKGSGLVESSLRKGWARGPRRAAVALGTAAALTVGGLVGALGAKPTNASSHREAPLISADPQADNTDLYAFVSPDHPDTVTLIANWSPFQEPNGGPNFFPFAEGNRHDINIDNDGDAKADLSYRWTFRTDDQRKNETFLYNNGTVDALDDENLLFRQFYTLEEIREDGGRRVLVKDGPVAPSNTGPASFPNYQQVRDQAVVKVGQGSKAFAGQAEDPFFLDLRVFDLLYGANLAETGQDTLAGYNVNTVALQVPKQVLALGQDATRNPVVGIWSTTQRRGMCLAEGGKREDCGDFVQVSRLGNPLVNEVVAPAGLKDAFNGLRPDQDAGVAELVDRVLNPEVPRLVEAIYGIPAPKGERQDLFEIFLTGAAKDNDGPIDADLNSQILNQDVDRNKFVPAEMLRLNMSVPPTAQPNRLGLLGNDLQGFPNGRRLTDDVLDIGLQALEGAAVNGIVEALAAGDNVNANDGKFFANFPYVALPSNQAVNQRLLASEAAKAK